MEVEHHDHETDSTEGTLLGKIKGLDYAYQAEMWAQDILTDRTTRRVYIFSGGKVYAVIGRDNDTINYIGRVTAYEGTWELPFRNPNATNIVSASLGREVATYDEAANWAQQALCGDVATAVLLDKFGILAAWEGGGEGFGLISKSPRPLRSQIFA